MSAVVETMVGAAHENGYYRMAPCKILPDEVKGEN